MGGNPASASQPCHFGMSVDCASHKTDVFGAIAWA
jgi:hypothetical protein